MLGFGANKRLVLGSGDSLDEVANNPATEWRLIGGTPALAMPSRRRFGIHTLALAASVEILLAVGAAYGYHAHTHHRLAGIGNLTICARTR